MKILAFGASYHSKSINQALIRYAATLLPEHEVQVLEIRNYDLPLFTQDKEAEIGSPPEAKAFFEALGGADGILISFAEHNGSYPAAYKNLFDWTSRIEQKIYQDKPMVMLATSPGGRGGQGVLKQAVDSAPYFGGEVRASFSLPQFHKNFDLEKGELTDPALLEQLKTALGSFSLRTSKLLRFFQPRRTCLASSWGKPRGFFRRELGLASRAGAPP